MLGDEYQADLDFFENINNDSEEEQTGANLDDEDDDEGHDSSPSSTESRAFTLSLVSSPLIDVSLLVDTRIRNTNVQNRARELLNKKDSKKPSSADVYTTDEIDQNSILNRTGLPDYDGVVYTLDAKLIGNIGRYFNHSCSPNIAVQNVFVDVRRDVHSLIDASLFRHMTSIFHGLDSLQRKQFDQGQSFGKCSEAFDRGTWHAGASF